MRMRVLETGEGPEVLHVHGGGGFGSLHVPLAAALPGRRHILIDRPGFGLSERVDLGVGPEFRARSVELLSSVLDALGLASVDVVANSIGGAMSLWLALDRPGRARSLGLVGAPAMVGAAAVPLPLRLLAAPVIGPLLMKLEPPSESQVRALWKRFGHDASSLHPTVLDVTLAAERLPHYARAWSEVLRDTISLAGTRPGLELSNGDLQRLNVPIAFAWGASDPMVGASVGRRVAAALPGARFVVAGAGHAPWLDDAPAVARAIEPVLATPS
jgi:pimeloyl-[acyl-carrier protein] methyl ester esterase